MVTAALSLASASGSRLQTLPIDVLNENCMKIDEESQYVSKLITEHFNICKK
jgi:hypothetical protein